jgi:hypothetical protein
MQEQEDVIRSCSWTLLPGPCSCSLLLFTGPALAA